ncbi:MAG: DUF2683 family protein [Saprospiraceae bacterium]
MTTITIKINEHTKAGKAFLAMSETFLIGVEGIEIVDHLSKKEEKSLYSKAFVAKMKRAEKNIKNRNTTQLNPNDIWGSIL